MLARPMVYTETATGTDRVWLDSIARVVGLRYVKQYPGGPVSATWQAAIDPRLQHRALRTTRRVGITVGASTIWTGKLDNPQPGSPLWTFTAVGRAAYGKNYQAYAPSTGNALNLNEVLDDAIANRALDWTRPASLPALTDGTAASGAQTIDDVLATVTQHLGRYWTLDRHGAITVGVAPTKVAYAAFVGSTGGGRTLSDFTTRVYVVYLDKTTNKQATRTRVNAAAFATFGEFENSLDVTGLGPMTAAQADSAGDSYLAQHAPRLKFTSPFKLTDGQLRTPTGVPIDLTTAEPGGLYRMLLTDQDTANGEVATGPIDLLMGSAEVDVDGGTLTVTPIDAAVNTFPALLSGAGSGGGPAPAASPAQVLSVASEGVASPWQSVPAASGFTSTVEVRQVGSSIEFRGAFATSSGSYPTGSTSTVVAVGANPYPPAVTRIVACGHTFGGGTAVSVCRVNIASNGSITVQNVEQTSVTTVWLDGVHISAT